MTALMRATRAGYTGTTETLIAASSPRTIVMQLKHNVAATDDLDLQSAHPSSTIEVSVIVWIFT